MTDPTPPAPPPAGTPLAWRIALLAGVAGLAGLAYALQGAVGDRGRAAFGVLTFVGLAAAFSADLRRVNWRTVGAGFALQILIAVLVIKVPAVYSFFNAVGGVVAKFLDFSLAGSEFVFGKLTDFEAVQRSLGNGFIFAVRALPPIIFVSSFFTVLYHLGVLQLVVRALARVMVFVMGTSGAETLSAVANVFMGQTEAPLIVKPYVARMTRSELLALMVGGMATISGGIMAALVSMFPEGQRQSVAVAILTTSLMAAPCGLYLAKLLIPETGEPETRGEVRADGEKTHVNVIDAAAAGASDGMQLAINVAAMLIAFIAFIALINAVLGLVHPSLSLQAVFSQVFSPVAFLLGVPVADVPAVADLLGTKLVLNEFVAYTRLTDGVAKGTISPEAARLAAYALTGFANFASIGIQLGGIGAMAPDRRKDLARLGGRALLGGFLATLINAAVAGMLT